MRTSLIFLTLVGFVACTTPWQTNQQYEYAFSANTLTGYGLGKDQYVAIISKGKLILQPESETVVRAKLSQVRYAHVHNQLTDGLNSRILDEKLSFNDKVSSDSLFSINYKNGVIHSLDVDSSFSNDEVNQLKTILSPLQVDKTGENVFKYRDNQLPGGQGLYKTIEATVTGECETIYEMSAVPAFTETEAIEQWATEGNLNMDHELFQIVKTVNYSNCDVRHSNQMEDFLSKTTVSRVIVSGSLDRFTIKSAETTLRILLYGDGQAEIVSRVAFELESIEAIKQALPVNADSLIHVGNLVYQYNIPSDEKNQARTSAKSSTDGSSSSSSSSSSLSSEEDQTTNRQRRSVKQNTANPSSFLSSTLAISYLLFLTISYLYIH